MKRSAIIVAGGKGLRMGKPTPKQFLLLDGKPIIVHTIEKFLSFDPHIQLVVVLPLDHMQTWGELKSTYFPDSELISVIGGEQRFDSVKAGLNALEGDGLVAIHDAVRPFVSTQTISLSFTSADQHGSGVTAVALKDSIRELKGAKSKARNRANFRIVQTPQTFRLEEIKAAYKEADHTQFTDDASVYEDAGYVVHLVEGSYTNVKITTPEDLK